METEINVFTRSAKNRGETKRLRRDGNIPFIMYAKGKNSEAGYVSKEQFTTIMRKLRPGFLPTTILALKDEAGKKRKVIVKDIQYHVTTYNVEHLDLLFLDDALTVDVKVPVECLNVIDCEGVKQGGFLRNVHRHVLVRCLPRDIPTHFEVDVKSLGVHQAIRIKDLTLPKGVATLAKPDDVVITIIKK